MYLKRAPASSGRALPRCGMSWGLSAIGEYNSSFSSSSFHWEIGMTKFEWFFRISYRWNRGKSSRQKSFIFHFSFIFLSDNFSNIGLGYFWSILWPHVVKIFMTFLHFVTNIDIKKKIRGQTWKILLMKVVALKIWIPNQLSKL